MKNIAIFASGSGTNAQNIIEFFQKHNSIKVRLIATNKPDAYVLERAQNFNIPTYVFNRTQLYETNEVVNFLNEIDIHFIVLAGFLWLMPTTLIQQYPNKIINIHPALLPKYGGKGMYGMKVHQAVIQNHEKESGITIHYVNEEYDKGNIIFQEKCKVTSDDTAETLAEKIHQMEYIHYPQVIESLVEKLILT